MTRLLRLCSCSWLAVFLWVLPSPPSLHACADFATAPHAQWQVVVQNGVSWLRTPCGERFLSIGVNAIDGGAPMRNDNGRISYHWGTFYPDLPTWASATRQRLAAWGFNTAGSWSIEPSKLALPFIPNLDLGRAVRFLWNDPFRPTMAEEMRTKARELVAPYKGNPYRIGYFPDNEIGWWYPSFFLSYGQQPATNATKQKFITLLRTHYHDNWERFVRDFVPPDGVSSFEELLRSSGAPTRLRVGGEGLQVVRRWTSTVAEHYYRLVHSAIREADPEALIFSERLQIYYDPDVIRPMAPYVDVVATNYDVDGQDGSLARYYFEGLRHLTGNKPVLVSEWFFAAHENRTGNRNRHITINQTALDGYLMTVQTQAQRTRGAMAAAQGFAQMPQLIGLHWFQYYDEPFGGRSDGEDYNFGLIDIHDRPYEELTEGFRRLNPRLMEIHQEAKPGVAALPPGMALEIPEAAIDPHDRSLQEWPKERAFVPGLTAPLPEVAFADVYLAWNQAGLYLATIGMDYCDPKLLAFDDMFPLAEVFRIEWGVDAGGGAQRFALYIVPPKEFSSETRTLTQAHLCRLTQNTCEPVPMAAASYFGYDSPRIIAEVAVPWQALGVDGPPPERHLRMEITATAYLRSRWMSWSGQPPAVGLHDPAVWHTVRLGKP